MTLHGCKRSWEVRKRSWQMWRNFWASRHSPNSSRAWPMAGRSWGTSGRRSKKHRRELGELCCRVCVCGSPTQFDVWISPFRYQKMSEGGKKVSSGFSAAGTKIKWVLRPLKVAEASYLSSWEVAAGTSIALVLCLRVIVGSVSVTYESLSCNQSRDRLNLLLIWAGTGSICC